MSNTLHARRLNHGQSGVWLGDESKRRIVATNAVYSAVRNHCSTTFHITIQAQLGTVGEVSATAAVARELGLTESHISTSET